METPSRYRTESYHPIPLSATSLAFTIHLAPKPTAAFCFLFLVRLHLFCTQPSLSALTSYCLFAAEAVSTAWCVCFSALTEAVLLSAVRIRVAGSPRAFSAATL